jgi:FAD/FMN-containing dehydrogenase
MVWLTLKTHQIRYANERNIPFFGRSGGHGATEAMALAQNAMQIDFRQLDHVIIAEDGKTATIGGGTKIKPVIDTLEAAGKRTGPSEPLSGFDLTD